MQLLFIVWQSHLCCQAPSKWWPSWIKLYHFSSETPSPFLTSEITSYQIFIDKFCIQNTWASGCLVYLVSSILSWSFCGHEQHHLCPLFPGLPKGAMLTHTNTLAPVLACLDLFVSISRQKCNCIFLLFFFWETSVLCLRFNLVNVYFVLEEIERKASTLAFYA